MSSPAPTVSSAWPKPCPKQPAVGLGEEGLGELVAAPDLVVERRVERVQPGVDAVLDRGAHLVERPRPGGEQREPDGHEQQPVRGDVDDGEEAAEEHQRRADVLDEEEHRHRRAPDEQQRAEVLERRQRDAGDPPPARDQQLARVAQVAGQEDDDRDLGELGGLEGQRAELHAEVGAVDALADPGHAREQQEQDPGHRDRVAVALEDAVVAQQDDRRREQDQPEHEPLRLLAGERLVDPVDHHQPEAGEHREQREQVRVGVGQREAQHDVGDEAQPQEHGAEGQRDVGEDVVALDEHRGEAAGDEQRRGHEREQFAVARAHRASSPVSRRRTRSCASSRGRSLCSVTVRRWLGVSSLIGTPET